MGKIKLDERGRILIPSEERKKLNLKAGEEFEMIEEKGMLLLKPIVPPSAKVRSKKPQWDKEAFLDAGEATFGE